MSFDYVLLWGLTIANSFAILLVVRQLSHMPAYRPVNGPRTGSRFADWTLRTLEGKQRSSAEMPSEYTILFASENCGPCHTLLAELGRSGRKAGTLVIAADGDATSLQRETLTSRGSVCDEFLTGADPAFRRRLKIPGTPFAVAVSREQVLASGPVRTSTELEKITDALGHAKATARDPR